MSISIDIHPSHNNVECELRIHATALTTQGSPLWLVIHDSTGKHLAEVTLFTNCGPMCDQLAKAINEINESWVRLPEEADANAD